MEKKQRLFIYDRKEVLILFSLAVALVLFSFTLGVHLAKSLGGQKVAEGSKDPGQLQGVPDEVPSRQELAERSETAVEEAKDAARQALKTEVLRTNIKTDHPKPLDLPGEKGGSKKAVSKPSEAHSDHAAPAPAAPKQAATTESHSDSHRAGRYTLQVGSYPSENEANDRKLAVQGTGLDVTVQPVDLGKKGKWYRVYLGAFSSAEEADKTGKVLQAKKSVDTFIVATKPQNH